MANRFFEGAAHAAAYAKFRPEPPLNLIKRIISFLKEEYTGSLETAADVGCGSGQGTKVLAPHFASVTGLDISDAQISQAVKKTTEKNMFFKVSGAEALPFSAGSVQLVTASQAAHWFDLPAFFAEADRVLVPGGVLALYGYLFPKPIHGNLSEKLCEIIDHVYSNETAGYWGSGRKDVDEGYTDEKFVMPYSSVIRDDTFYVDKIATVADLKGYLSSWSGIQNFRAANGDDAAQKILDDFQNKFMTVLDVTTPPENTEICMRFTCFLLMGRKPLN